MTTLTHIAVGYLLADTLVRSGLVPTEMLPHVYAASIIFANLPDLDAVVLGKIYDHRTKSPLHYPFTWWVIFVTATVLALATNQNWWLLYIGLGVISIVIHFLMDTVAVTGGICWLAPFYYNEYSFIPFTKATFTEVSPKYLKKMLVRYLKHPVMWLEVMIWISAFWTARHATIYAGALEKF
ncbi:MAG: hypothetical protein UX37_C0015G0008 [Microgenomates group bacterium GW2011_GWA2_46_16]|nr:MAG: hypothetical protein UX37_C0015G0008 [Microgenomates group bacterium GW2011_GWA2_46_16]